MGTGEFVRYRRHPASPELGMLHARYVRHAFGRHAHPTYTIGVIEQGAEELAFGNDRENVTAGAVVLINPEAVHTGRAIDEQGWTYHALYLPVEFVHSVVGETPRFAERVVYDSRTRQALREAIQAIDEDDCTAGTVLCTALARVFTRYGDFAETPAPGNAVAAAARDILSSDYLSPPSLGELATRLGTNQFALVRAFRDTYGLPPHSYLTQHRIRKACALINRGTGLADAALAVGFADQAHLNRHFRKTLGITPGQYRNAVQERTRSAG